MVLRPLAWLLGGLAALAALVFALVAVALAVAYPNLPPIDSLTDYRPKLPLRVFSTDGVLLGEFAARFNGSQREVRLPDIAQRDALLGTHAASEQGARMSAMDNATRNAGDMINKLSIKYNRQRQAQITKELIEIISGAEAL